MDINASLIARVLDLAVTIQQIPAPPFGEGQRAAFIHERFKMDGFENVQIDDLGNVYGCLSGLGEKRPLIVSAHLDTVFPYDTDLRVRREDDKIFGPGIGDNSLGVAGLFGLFWLLREVTHKTGRLPGDVWFVANVGEEGLGDLRGMKAVVDRFRDKPLAYLVLEGMSFGVIYHRGLGVQRYRINVRTEGGHSWVDYGRPSAIHELAGLITQLTAIQPPRRPRSSLNVGVVSGGTSVNTIASEAHLELDLRSEGAAALKRLIEQVEHIAGCAEKPGVKISLDVIGQRPAGKIPASHPLVRLALKALSQPRMQEFGLHPKLAIGSTDANIPLSRGYPAVTIGLSSGFGAHTINEYIHIKPLFFGLEQLVDVVVDGFKELN